MYKQLQLKNGLPVILVPKKDSQSLTLLVIYKVGSRHEDDAIGGISHFIEHMMFKGTKKRPQAIDIAKDLDNVGAEYNAFTSKDHTGYWVKMNAEHLDLACDVVADMIYNSKFDETEINRERGVILEEFNMYKDNPLIYLEEIFEGAIYEGNNLGRDTIGTASSIKAISQAKILTYKKSFYKSNNAILVVAGNTSGAEKFIKKYFDIASQGMGDKPAPFEAFLNKQSEPRLSLKYKETEQVHLGIGFPAYSYFDSKLDAFQVLAIILGGSMSSRLFVQVRERRGLCYYIKAQANVYEDTGNLFIRAGLDKNKIEEALEIILDELLKIKTEGISDAELKLAKELVKGHMILEMEDNSSLAQWYARRFILMNKIITPEEKIKQIQKVTKAQVNAVAKELINKKLLNLVAISPYKDVEKFKKIINAKLG